MGGNLQGVRAGALAWFGKEPAQLSPAEAALLVALPQAPRRTRPDAPGSRAGEARAKVLERGRRDGLLTQAAVAAAVLAPLPNHRLPFPALAPHLAERLAETTQVGPVATTLDRTIQRDLERMLREALNGLPRPVTVAALVADWHTGEILAEAGSGDYFDASRRGAVDMTTAVRSPGSTLKPFIYGMAFDRLLAHPDSLVRDEPTRFDDYAPHNFDGGFVGDVTVRRALQASLNLPAVLVLQRLGPVAFADAFRQAGLPLQLKGDAAPSLPLALGGVGTTLRDLVTGYAALADGGKVKPLSERREGLGPPRRAADLLTSAGADAVTEILAGLPPPRGTARRAATIAFKTGTSFRFRDGWAIGFDGARVIGVWMGRADGATCLGCVGAAAAGLLFRAFDLLEPAPLPRRTLAPVFAEPPPPALARLTAAPTSPNAEAPAHHLPGRRARACCSMPGRAGGRGQPHRRWRAASLSLACRRRAGGQSPFRPWRDLVAERCGFRDGDGGGRVWPQRRGQSARGAARPALITVPAACAAARVRDPRSGA